MPPKFSKRVLLNTLSYSLAISTEDNIIRYLWTTKSTCTTLWMSSGLYIFVDLLSKCWNSSLFLPLLSMFLHPYMALPNVASVLILRLVRLSSNRDTVSSEYPKESVKNSTLKNSFEASKSSTYSSCFTDKISCFFSWLSIWKISTCLNCAAETCWFWSISVNLNEFTTKFSRFKDSTSYCLGLCNSGYKDEKFSWGFRLEEVSIISTWELILYSNYDSIC